MSDFDTTHVLALLRQHTAFPAVQGWDDANCLRLLTSVLHGYMLPMIKAEWQEHYLSSEATTWTVPLEQGKREYMLPAHAVGASIRKAVLTGPNNARRPLRLFEVDKQEEWNTARADLPEGYTLRGGRLYLHPAPSATAAAGWSLRAQVLVRPARMALPETCAQVTEVDVGDATGLYAVTNPPEGIIGATVDVVRGVPPFETLSLAVTPAESSVVGFTTYFTVASGAIADLQAGDWLCPPGTAPFAQMPVEMLEVLTTRAAVEQLGTAGDTPVATAKAATLQEQRKDAQTLATPRTGEARLQGNGMDKFRAYGSSGRWW